MSDPIITRLRAIRDKNRPCVAIHDWSAVLEYHASTSKTKRLMAECLEGMRIKRACSAGRAGPAQAIRAVRMMELRAAAKA